MAVTIHLRNELDTEVSGLRAKVRLLKQVSGVHCTDIDSLVGRQDPSHVVGCPLMWPQVAGDIHSEAVQQQTILEQLVSLHSNWPCC